MRGSTPDRADVLVVGAGTAGCVPARILAESGHSVLLIDRKKAPEIGRKTCGDTLSDDGFAAICRHIARPRSAEVAGLIRGGTLILPDGKIVRTSLGGVVLNRLIFGQRLLADALAAGAVLLDGCSCTGWEERETGRVRIRRHDGTETVAQGKIVIDASGFRAILTRHGGASHPDPLLRESAGIAYREIAPTIEPREHPTEAIVRLTPEFARGAYAWVFPISERLANIGFGGPLAAVGHRVQSSYRRFVEETTALKLAEPLAAGTGLLPIRPPVCSMVGDAFMSAGDAACQADPLHGAGIAPSILAGSLAGEVARAALDSGDTSALGLWRYNVDFMRDTGATHAAHFLLRKLLESLSSTDLSFVAARLAGAGAAMRATEDGRARFSLGGILEILRAGARRPGLARLILRAGRLMERASRLYQDYPESPAGLPSWIRSVEKNNRAIAKLVGGRAGAPRR